MYPNSGQYLPKKPTKPNNSAVYTMSAGNHFIPTTSPGVSKVITLPVTGKIM